MQPLRVPAHTWKGKHFPFAFLFVGVFAAHAAEFHVGPKGKDANRGTRSSPFATLDRARGAVRSLKQGPGLPVDGVTIWIHGGEYELASTFELGLDDSGQPNRPVVYRAAGGNYGAVFSHGGHDNSVRNCIFVECPLALGSAPWNDKLWQEYLTGELWQEKLRKDVDITRPPYVERYPGLKGFMEFAGEPRRNHASANLIVNCRAVQTGNWDVTDSFVTATDPGFVNSEKLDFQLRDDAAALAQIPGFEKFPFAQIGLQRDEFRRRLEKRASE